VADFSQFSSTARKMEFEELNPVAMLSKPFYLKDLVNAVDETVGTEKMPDN
jgi:hypothetical protein